ncbi:hypothetical protein [Hominibacterium faecale]|uniref:hypothetical protein n=1 Tax=Hominibacterium faecale TaxID=2839743 RepID=UPI0022B2AACF|nr:hypothetical protein [Hominibacterium faecale]
MRMKKSRMTTYHLRNKIVDEDREGASIISYADAKQLRGEIWPAGGKLQTEQYGNRIDAIMNCKVAGTYKIEQEGNHCKYAFADFELREDDGICIYAMPESDPDYRIVAIKPYKPLYMEVERL